MKLLKIEDMGCTNLVLATIASSERAYNDRYVRVGKLCVLLVCEHFMLRGYFVKDEDEDQPAS